MGQSTWGGIITLCNRFSSLEEEYERLISADKKESTYQVELETQHMENEKLRQIKETVEKERINAADFEHEKKRQVNYLEKENLQILEELKASKRNFIKMKTLNKMQSSNPGENLIEKYK